MSLFAKVFGSRQPNTIEVVNGKDRHLVDFADGTIEDGTITVGILRSQCKEFTQVPAENIKLLFRGKNLTDDSVKLSSVGMKSGSKVLCVASLPVRPLDSPEGSAAGSPQQAPNSKARAPVDQLADLLAIIRQDLEPAVQDYINQVPEDPRRRKETHDHLAELLLQKLFALDGITCKDEADDKERDEVRKKRKEGVNYTQSLLDSVDDVIKLDDADTGAIPSTI